jgi:hypothetical protein
MVEEDPKIAVTFASEYWQLEDYNELISVFDEKLQIKNKEMARWAAELTDPAIMIFFTVLAKPFLDTAIKFLTSELFEKFTDKLSKKMKDKKYPHVILSFHDEHRGIVFEMTSTNDETISKSLKEIKEILTHTPLRNDKEYFYYNTDKEFWEQLINKSVDEFYYATIAGLKPFEKDGKTIQLTRKDLENIARNQNGMPVLKGHHSKPVGIVLDAWIEKDEVKTKVGIFSDVSKEDRKEMKKWKGFSLGAAY